MWNWYAHGRKDVWDAWEKRTGRTMPRDLASVLQRATGAFEGMRYHYENPVVDYQFSLDDLPHMLGLMAIELRPEWAGQAKGWKSDNDFEIPS
jgi:hypothetical protein